MAQGKVKFFNQEKGYGFITPEDGGKDLFVHVSALASDSLNENDTVEYEVGEGQKGPCAVNVKVVS
ncbi:MAG: cold-shock protein [Halobacteriovoraceae bacterium]|nr:cold-shock protein [Halobacteriovoraceae bacterium]|tara:strand:+ start:38505 stop:38702 length:198 start_codon:yes stop_codon:yes gene_type:complete